MVAVGAAVDVASIPVFSGRSISVNELKAMAILEAVHTNARLQESCKRLCGGRFVEADSFQKVVQHEGWLEEYCLAFALDDGGAWSGDTMGAAVPPTPSSGIHVAVAKAKLKRRLSCKTSDAHDPSRGGSSSARLTGVFSPEPAAPRRRLKRNATVAGLTEPYISVPYVDSNMMPASAGNFRGFDIGFYSSCHRGITALPGCEENALICCPWVRWYDRWAG